MKSIKNKYLVIGIVVCLFLSAIIDFFSKPCHFYELSNIRMSSDHIESPDYEFIDCSTSIIIGSPLTVIILVIILVLVIELIKFIIKKMTKFANNK